MFASSHTLLLITRDVVARVDLCGRRRLQVQNVWVQSCTETATPTAAAALAFNLGPRRSGQIWVLSSDFWSGIISLSDDVAALLSPTELDQALALEAEIDSGVSAFASRVGAMKLAQRSPGESRWCVTQVSSADLQYLQEALEKHSSTRLVGVAHPAAGEVAEGIAEGTAAPDELLAGWDDRLLPTGQTSADETRAAVASWAERWAGLLTDAPLAPLVIRCETPPQSTRQQVTVLAALALLAACACTGWHWQTQRRIEAAVRTIARLEERQSAHEATQRDLQITETRVAKLRKETAQAEAQRRELENVLHRAERTHAQHNRRWLAVLDAIAGSVDNQCWIQRLESQPLQATVHGLATDNAAAHRFASALEACLEGSGWTVLPAETKAAQQQLVAFRIVLAASPSPAKSNGSAVASLSAHTLTSHALASELRSAQPRSENR